MRVKEALKKCIKPVGVVFIIMLVVVSCVPGDTIVSDVSIVNFVDVEELGHNSSSEVIDSKETFYNTLTPDEQDYVQMLKLSGSLPVAMRIDGTITRQKKGFGMDGFHYNLLMLFAEYLEVPVEINLSSFNRYFENDGFIPSDIKVNENIRYTPDAFDDSLMLVDNLTIMPWREKLMDFIEIIPVSVVIMTTDDLIINDLQELNGLEVAVTASTSYASIMEDLIKTYDLDIKVNYVSDSHRAKIMMLEGGADFVFRDSNTALYEAVNNDRFNVSFSVSKPDSIGWAVEKDNQVLKSIGEKFIRYTIETGELEDLWVKEYGIPFRAYSDILRVMDYTNKN
ncbi:hypothetical protein [Fusibacter sp. JL216-2]|uniref:hypothetical protein n=1 Tax=Fusibacter sp. JL216-2 TaxID=3071453 RepID=UPI003D343019